MRRVHGKVLVLIGIIHILFSFIPGVFGGVLAEFSHKLFFNLNQGFFDFPLYYPFHL